MLGLVPASVAGGLRGSGERGPRRGDVGGSRWVIVRHGPLRLADIRSVSVAGAKQVDAFPAGVPNRQSLVECVAPSRVVGLYEGVLLGKVGSPGVARLTAGSAAVGLTPLVESSGEKRWSQGPPCRLLTCGWLVRDLRCACAAVRRPCSAGDQLRSAGHVRAVSAGAGRSRRRCTAFS